MESVFLMNFLTIKPIEPETRIIKRGAIMIAERVYVVK